MINNKDPAWEYLSPKELLLLEGPKSSSVHPTSSASFSRSFTPPEFLLEAASDGEDECYFNDPEEKLVLNYILLFRKLNCLPMLKPPDWEKTTEDGRPVCLLTTFQGSFH